MRRGDTLEEQGPKVTMQEFEKKALNDLKSKQKAYGADNIPAELL
jgi:hypothetical protein